MIKEWLRKKARDNAEKTFTNKIKVTSPTSQMALMNHACHLNAVNAVRTGKAVCVVEVVVISDDSCVAHYINMLDDGSFVDFTLGWPWTGAEYRLIRYMHESLYGEISDELGRLKERLCNPIANKMKFTIYGACDIC